MGSGGFWWVLVGPGRVLVDSGGFCLAGFWWVLVGSGGVLVGSGGFLWLLVGFW
jgi:hypothetical protein